MKQKIILLTAILLANINVFSQNEEPVKTNRKIAIELNAGKLFSPYRFYRNHTGYENLWLGVSKNLSDKYGLLLSQSYGRLYSERTNNLTMVYNTTISDFVNFFTDKKINLRVALGTGFTYISTKCLYDEYPLNEHYTAVPVRLNIAAFYKLNDRFSLNINLDSQYSWMFSYQTHRLIINDPYYYKTFFYSLNLGVRYFL